MQFYQSNKYGIIIFRRVRTNLSFPEARWETEMEWLAISGPASLLYAEVNKIPCPSHYSCCYDNPF